MEKVMPCKGRFMHARLEFERKTKKKKKTVEEVIAMFVYMRNCSEYKSLAAIYTEKFQRSLRQ